MSLLLLGLWTKFVPELMPCLMACESMTCPVQVPEVVGLHKLLQLPPEQPLPPPPEVELGGRKLLDCEEPECDPPGLYPPLIELESAPRMLGKRRA